MGWVPKSLSQFAVHCLDSGASMLTLVRMNTFAGTPVFEIGKVAGTHIFFTYDEAVPIEALLLERLDQVPEGGLLVIDFENVRMASEAARQFLRRAIMRIGNGELRDRYVILAHLERCRYSLDAMLRKESLTVVERTAEGPRLVGQAEGVATETFEFVASLDT